jgi:hypothetical protein
MMKCQHVTCQCASMQHAKCSFSQLTLAIFFCFYPPSLPHLISHTTTYLHNMSSEAKNQAWFYTTRPDGEVGENNYTLRSIDMPVAAEVSPLPSSQTRDNALSSLLFSSSPLPLFLSHSLTHSLTHYLSLCLSLCMYVLIRMKS